MQLLFQTGTLRQIMQMQPARTELLPPTTDGIARAAALLQAGELVALPTETVYGLAGNARDDAAIAKIYRAKGRPAHNPLIVHVAGLQDALALAGLDPVAMALARAFWPGPLTLVAPLRDGHGLCPAVTAGLPTVALRIPQHPLARQVLRQFAGPLAAPSANPSGRISPTTPAHVLAGLEGRIAAVLDGGPCPVGLESTILTVEDGRPVLLRAGGISTEAVAQALGQPVQLRQSAAMVTAPGQLASHYAPRAALRLNVRSPRADEIWIGFGPDCAGAELSLSPTGNLQEAAARLFATLHQADATGRPIAVAPVPDHDLGRGINDRLRRASAPRDS